MRTSFASQHPVWERHLAKPLPATPSLVVTTLQARPIRRSCGIPLAALKRFAEGTGPGNCRTRTVMPCSGQLLHVHEPRTMNSLAADNLLAHSRTRAATLAIWLNKMPSTQKPADAEGQAGAGPAASTGCAVFAKAGFLCDNRRHPFGDINRPVGAAGAQVPYKHKVTGSNPVPATIKIAGQTLFSSDLFSSGNLRQAKAPDKLAAIGHASLPSICRTHKNVR